jgi:hypothetical protein
VRTALADALARPARRVTSTAGGAPATLILAGAIVLQLAVASWFAFATPHNGLLWYSGGDATEYWTEQWAVGHLVLPQPVIGWALPVLYAWIPLLAGPSLLNGLPVLVALQTLILLPLSVMLFFLLAGRLYGRVFGLYSTFVWILAPVLLLLCFNRPSYREKFEQLFAAPHLYGLTNMGDFPSLVLVIAAALATVRAASSRFWRDAVLAGLLVGLLIGVKPANAFFVPAAAVLILLSRSTRVAIAFAAGVAPALVTLFFWKHRGLGYTPLTSYGDVRVAAPPDAVASILPERYVPLSWHNLTQTWSDFGEVFRSPTLLALLVALGIAGAARRNWRHAIFLVLWAGAFLLVKGSSGEASVVTTSYYRLTVPGLPPLAILVASSVFLVPRPARRSPEPSPARPVHRGWLAAVALVAGLIPLVLVLVIRSPATLRTVRDSSTANEAPLDSSLRARVASTPDGPLLSWRPFDGGSSNVYYIVYRSVDGTDGCTLPERGARMCMLAATLVGTTADTTFTVRRAGIYRVAVAAYYVPTFNGSDLMLLGPPARVIPSLVSAR